MQKAELQSGHLVARPAQRALLELMLASGGDERIAVDPLTGRNRYGTPPGPAVDEVWFASSTASSTSPRGYAAAAAALDTLSGTNRAIVVESWFDRLRERLVHSFGIPGTSVILTGSGTEAELVALTIARAVLKRPLTNLIVAPAETGSGVLLAASGRHFLRTASCRPTVARGKRLAGLRAADIDVEHVEIRLANGRIRAADDVDVDAERIARAALARTRAVLAHVLDASKTGQAGLQRSTAAAIREGAPDRVLVLVDACQLRCSSDQIRADLQGGSMVMITGSKFAGGPPFAGALLLPPCLLARLGSIRLPGGLSAYSAVHDWPSALRVQWQGSLKTHANLGLGLRWEAALAEIECYLRVAPGLRSLITEAFGSAVRAAIQSSAGLRLIDGSSGGELAGRTIFPVVTHAPGGHALEADGLRVRLRSAPFAQGAHDLGCSRDRRYHVGQPVAVGTDRALRICLSAPMVVDVAHRFDPTTGLSVAMTSLAEDLSGLFDKWTAIRSAFA